MGVAGGGSYVTKQATLQPRLLLHLFAWVLGFRSHEGPHHRPPELEVLYCRGVKQSAEQTARMENIMKGRLCNLCCTGNDSFFLLSFKFKITDRIVFFKTENYLKANEITIKSNTTA